jgi:predicted nuclease of predicted toxin-antitoxin system
MRFFADHCVPHSIGETLTSEGHEVIRLSTQLPSDADDSTVIEKAQEMNAVLLSLNGDFADLIRYPPDHYGGIVALQVRNRPEAIPSIVDKLLKYMEQHPRQKHYSGKLFLVEAHRIRVRRGT